MTEGKNVNKIEEEKEEKEKKILHGMKWKKEGQQTVKRIKKKKGMSINEEIKKIKQKIKSFCKNYAKK